MADNKAKTGSNGRSHRALILTVMIVLVTFFWVVILLNTNLPILALVGIGLLSVLVLAVATAWTAVAFPSRSER